MQPCQGNVLWDIDSIELSFDWYIILKHFGKLSIAYEWYEFTVRELLSLILCVVAECPSTDFSVPPKKEEIICIPLQIPKTFKDLSSAIFKAAISRYLIEDADELFNKIIKSNQAALCNAIEASLGIESRGAKLFREALNLQLDVLSNCN